MEKFREAFWNPLQSPEQNPPRIPCSAPYRIYPKETMVAFSCYSGVTEVKLAKDMAISGLAAWGLKAYTVYKTPMV